MNTAGEIASGAAVAYILTGWAIAFRVGWLRSSGRVPAAPTTEFLLWGDLGMAGFGFILSGQHKKLKDRITTALVWVSRAAISAFGLFLTTYWLTPH
jgi:hypothetical protein